MVAWIFDMDGTLTEPQHDFAALKCALGLPPTLDVLGGIQAAPEDQRADLMARVSAWELEHAHRAIACAGALELLDALAGHPVGVLTRNTRDHALITLQAAGLMPYFEPDHVLGRDCARPKPAPDGVLLACERLGVEPARSVMVGDWIHDVEAGRSAGARTIWLDRTGTGRFAGEADLTVRRLSASLIALLD